MSRQPGTAWGVYGLRISGLPDPERHLAAVPPSWPELALEFSQAPIEDPRPAGTIELTEARAELWLAEAGRIALTRDPLAVRFTTPHRLTPDAVLHPFLGLPACIANRWFGRAALHGGAFRHGGVAWGLLGNREAGKSATLGQLLAEGVEVLSDDVLILDGERMYSGPRSVDLREDAAAVVGGEALGVVGNRERWRLRPAAGPACLPLGGFIRLEWGEETRIEPLPVQERLRTLVGSSALRPSAADAELVLDLVSRPAWRFVRPRRLDALGDQVSQLLAALPA
jgi:hypothetical protein